MIEKEKEKDIILTKEELQKHPLFIKDINFYKNINGLIEDLRKDNSSLEELEKFNEIHFKHIKGTNLNQVPHPIENYALNWLRIQIKLNLI